MITGNLLYRLHTPIYKTAAEGEASDRIYQSASSIETHCACTGFCVQCVSMKETVRNLWMHFTDESGILMG